MASELMSNEIALLAIFILSVFVGFEVVSKVSTTLHTPLMSGANAIHGVILVGAIVVADHAKTTLEISLAIAAVILATINMVGGFVVTDRMLQMFKGKGKPKKDKGENK
jgi:NAD(P) transhydrogenase subunit alpha